MEFAGEREQGTLCPTLVTMHAEFEAPFPSHLLSNPADLKRNVGYSYSLSWPRAG